MKIKKTKRGFTIVELVIVIAVIGVLTAILVPTFINLTAKANKASDNSLVANLNTALKMQEGEATDKKNETMHDAVEDLDNYGYNLTNLVAKSSDDLLYSLEENRFYLSDAEQVKADLEAGKGYKYWHIQDNLTNPKGYSIYAGRNFGETTVSVTAGFDAGDKTTITSVTYDRHDATVGQDVVIRTNGGSLKIIDTNDASHQYHFGSSASVEVTTGNNCYEGHAVVAAMKVKAGKIIASNDSYIGLVEVASGVTLEETTKGVFVIPENADAEKIDATAAASVGYTIEGGTITPSAEKAEKSFYLIENASSLLAFSTSWNNGDGQFINKIKFADNVVIDINQTPWIPIGTWEHPFHGTIEGMGCTIRGLGANVNYSSLYSADKKYYVKGATTGVEGYAFGLIGIAGNGDVEVKDINFADVSIDIPSGNMVAAVIGFAPSTSKFKDSEDNPGFYDDWADSTTIGTHNVTISNINVSGTISAEQDAASIAGKLYNSGKQVIKNCTNSANIVANTTNSAGRASGIVSMCSNSSELLIENCINKGSVTAVKYACGILAYASNISGTIKNCVNNGTITATATKDPRAADIWHTSNKSEKSGIVNIRII